MARDPDGRPQRPFETRGRRPISQRSRDLSEKLRSYGALLDGSPKLLETMMGSLFIGGLVYFLRPQITLSTPAFEIPPYSTFRGKSVDKLTITYPDKWMGRNISVLASLIVAPVPGGDIGSILVPAGTALVFSTFIDRSFPDQETFNGFDLAFGPYGVKPGQGGDLTGLPHDATIAVYTKIILPRYVRALFVAAFFYIVLRFVRSLGRT